MVLVMVRERYIIYRERTLVRWMENDKNVTLVVVACLGR